MEDCANLIWTGSELGYLKSVDPCKNIVQNYGELSEEWKLDAPVTLSWKDTKEKEMLVGTKSGNVKSFSTETEKFDESFLKCGEASIVGVAVYDDKILACDEKGVLVVWDGDEMVKQKQIGDDIRKIKQNTSRKNHIACGGKENNLKLFDIEQLEKPVFTAKNVRNDSLDLRQPVWVSALDFIQGEENKIVVGTGYHKIQIYDTRKQRRPVEEMDWDEYPITAISMTADGNDLIVGNTTGNMASFDLRKKEKKGSFKGIAGSISSIRCHHSQDFVTCVGLDRFLRVYDVKTRQLLQKVYLKSRLSCLLLSDKIYGDDLCRRKAGNESNKSKEKNTEVLGNDDDDENQVDDAIWDEMEITSDETKGANRKKKMINLKVTNAKKKKID